MIKKVIVFSLLLLWGLDNKSESLAQPISKACISALDLALKEKWDQAYQALPAQTCPLTAEVIQWLDLKNDYRHHTFQEYQQFLSKHPDWPWAYMLRKRAETKIDTHVPDAMIITWYQDNPVRNCKAARRYIESLMNAGLQQKAKKVIRQTWVNLDFEIDQEKSFKATYAPYLTLSDHQARTDRLLWEGKTQPAKRMLASLDKNYQLLGDARIAIIEQATEAQRKCAQLPAFLKKNIGLIYDQVRNYHKTDNLEGARLLLTLLPHPSQLKDHHHLWWKECRYFAREALNQKQPKLAYDILKNHKFAAGEDYAESEWFLGWISLSFLNQPQTALTHFKRMLADVKTPLSKAKAHYWCGRACEVLGQREASHTWFEAASKAFTTYYGQLAIAKIGLNHKLKLLDHLPIAMQARQNFERHEFVRIVRLLAVSGHAQEALPFLYLLGERMPNRPQRFMAIELAKEILPSFAIQAIKKAERVELPMVRWAYPSLPFKTETAIEKALILAVIRQESDFNPLAVSPAGARGLMQIMPHTAQKVAKDLGLPYKESRLVTDPVYNAQLGSHYLEKKLEQFEGSYILAIASYNAGAKPVWKWIERNGDPRQKGVDLTQWIEMIPYGETRTYIQRVLSNLYVYRQILSH
jgi:soluble lytic murein transglycosylase